MGWEGRGGEGRGGEGRGGEGRGWEGKGREGRGGEGRKVGRVREGEGRGRDHCYTYYSDIQTNNEYLYLYNNMTSRIT